jgi:hypothetical protein
MNKELPNRPKNSAGPSPERARVLQRKCACGGSSASGECEECKKKELQGKATGGGGAAIAPPIVNDVLHSPGRPLDAQTRSFFEPRFGHDFSKVRVHTDESAAESAQAVSALAYTFGSHVVFGAGQYTPQAVSGQRLLAHELAHVVQQHGQPANSPQSIAGALDPSEYEADRMAHQAAGGDRSAPVSKSAGPQLMRKLKVDKPGEMIPNPSGQGVKETNAQAVEDYLNKLAEGSGAKVNQSTGMVSVSTAYCQGFLGGLVAGAKGGFGIFKGISVLNVLLGVPAAIGGALIGGIAGLFGSEKFSAAGSSSTPTGSTCICDFIDDGKIWTIALNDKATPATLNGRKVQVPSPNSPKTWGSALMSGRLDNEEPWLILGHELCGHAWLELKGKEETAEEERHKGEGFHLVEPKTASSPLRHEHTVERENLIRKEHGLDPRGYRLRDPYCGESFWRERGVPEGPVHWQEMSHPDAGAESGADAGADKKKAEIPTYLMECAKLRSELPENKDGKYPVDKAIP